MVVSIKATELDGRYQLIVRGKGRSGKRGKETLGQVLPEDMQAALDSMVKVLEDRIGP